MYIVKVSVGKKGDTPVILGSHTSMLHIAFHAFDTNGKWSGASSWLFDGLPLVWADWDQAS